MVELLGSEINCLEYLLLHKKRALEGVFEFSPSDYIEMTAERDGY